MGRYACQHETAAVAYYFEDECKQKHHIIYKKREKRKAEGDDVATPPSTLGALLALKDEFCQVKSHYKQEQAY